MKLFESNFTTVLARYYAMMALILIAGFTGIWWLAVLAFPILLSALLSVRINDRDKSSRSAKVVTMPKPEQNKRVADG